MLLKTEKGITNVKKVETKKKSIYGNLEFSVEIVHISNFFIKNKSIFFFSNGSLGYLNENFQFFLF